MEQQEKGSVARVKEKPLRILAKDGRKEKCQWSKWLIRWRTRGGIVRMWTREDCRRRGRARTRTFPPRGTWEPVVKEDKCLVSAVASLTKWSLRVMRGEAVPLTNSWWNDSSILHFNIGTIANTYYELYQKSVLFLVLVPQRQSLSSQDHQFLWHFFVDTISCIFLSQKQFKGLLQLQRFLLVMLSSFAKMVRLGKGKTTVFGNSPLCLLFWYIQTNLGSATWLLPCRRWSLMLFVGVNFEI